MSEESGKGKKPAKSRGVGQVIERGKDKFLIRIYLGRDSTGKRHYHNEMFHGKKTQAKEYLRRLLTKHKNGEALTLGNDTLGAFIDNEWLKAHPDLKESSLEQYQRIVDYYLRPTLGKMLLSKIDAAKIQSLYDDLLKQGLSSGTVVYVHTLTASIFKLALKRRKIAVNPMEGVKSPGGKKTEQEKQAKRAARTMAAEQVRLFLAAADETRFGAIFTLAFNTGCRPGELLGLKWADLDALARILKIREAIKWRKGGQWYLDTPKTAHGRRTLRLTDGLIELLDRHRKRQLEERIKAGSAWTDHGFIFTDEVGEPYSQSKLRYYCKEILKAAGLPEIFNPYSARHTSATLLAEEGVNIKTISERLGHSDAAITLQIYTHPTGGMHQEASEEIERLIKGQK